MAVLQPHRAQFAEAPFQSRLFITPLGRLHGDNWEPLRGQAVVCLGDGLCGRGSGSVVARRAQIERVGFGERHGPRSTRG